MRINSTKIYRLINRFTNCDKKNCLKQLFFKEHSFYSDLTRFRAVLGLKLNIICALLKLLLYLLYVISPFFYIAIKIAGLLVYLLF